MLDAEATSGFAIGAIFYRFTTDADWFLLIWTDVW